MKWDWAEPLRQASAEQRAFVNSPAGQRFDWEVFCVLLATAVLLTLQKYVLVDGDYRLVARWVGSCLPSSWQSGWTAMIAAPENQEIVRMTYWGLGQVLLYTVLPCVIIVGVTRRPWIEYGVKLRGLTKGAWVYGLMLLGMLPAIWLASRRSSFQHTYPFYRLYPGEPLWPRLLAWEVLYALQFVALEFFFRGFLLHGTRRRFGPYAILVMMVPYCMIHFGKPMLETCGAIGAGLILGYMSLKTRSVWLGAVLHVCVAWTMDTLAIMRMSQ